LCEIRDSKTSAATTFQQATKKKKTKNNEKSQLHSTHFQSTERFSREPDVASTVATDTKRIKTSMMVVVEVFKRGVKEEQAQSNACTIILKIIVSASSYHLISSLSITSLFFFKKNFGEKLIVIQKK
jgi:hypothetical protein